MIDATAIIMTKNEEKNIVECLKSMQGFAKRCVVIDCGSADKTVELAKQYGADVFFHEFEYYARQFNWGIDNCSIDTEWIIRLDADERFPVELINEIEDCIQQNAGQQMNGIIIAADLFFMGKFIKHGVPNKRKMMLFKASCGRIEDRRRDAHSVITEGFALEMKHHFLHYDYKDLDSFIKRYNWYATREMMDYFDYKNSVNKKNVEEQKDVQRSRGRKIEIYYKLPKYVRAWMLFIYNYIIRFGFLDGSAGLVYNFFDTYWYRFLVDAKISEHQKNGIQFEELKSIE